MSYDMFFLTLKRRENANSSVPVVRGGGTVLEATSNDLRLWQNLLPAVLIPVEDSLGAMSTFAAVSGAEIAAAEFAAKLLAGTVGDLGIEELCADSVHN